MIITPDILAQAIASSPAWAEIASGGPQKRINDDAHHEVAKHVYDALWRPCVADAADQMALPL